MDSPYRGGHPGGRPPARYWQQVVGLVRRPTGNGRGDPAAQGLSSVQQGWRTASGDADVEGNRGVQGWHALVSAAVGMEDARREDGLAHPPPAVAIVPGVVLPGQRHADHVGTVIQRELERRPGMGLAHVLAAAPPATRSTMIFAPGAMPVATVVPRPAMSPALEVPWPWSSLGSSSGDSKLRP